MEVEQLLNAITKHYSGECRALSAGETYNTNRRDRVLVSWDIEQQLNAWPTSGADGLLYSSPHNSRCNLSRPSRRFMQAAIGEYSDRISEHHCTGGV